MKPGAGPPVFGVEESEIVSKGATHQAEREYIRDLNAAKLERAFAKPFVRAYEGHQDGVYRLCKWTGRLDVLGSASGDGEVRIWNTISG